MTDHCVYLDYQATTPSDPRVVEAMLPFLSVTYGNPSSMHVLGRQAASGMDAARSQLRTLIGASYDSEIVFTSGATEADHLAIAGSAAALRDRGDHIVTTAIEHKAVLAVCERLSREGYRITRVPVGRDGLVDPADIAAAITTSTVLVTVMHVNNEIGTIQPLAEISALTRERGVLLHTDAAQSIGTLPFNVDSVGVDLASFSAHKVYGPKGIGALYIRHRSRRPLPQFTGGGQEFGMRAGTPNVTGIVGFGAAAAILRRERTAEAQRIAEMRDYLLCHLQDALPHAYINGTMAQRLPGNISITVPGIDAHQLVSEMLGLAISTGSACSTGDANPSHVLTAIGLHQADARATLRISVGRPTTRDQIDYAAKQLVEAISQHLSVACKTSMLPIGPRYAGLTLRSLLAPSVRCQTYGRGICH
jgi:cysteine desulfurase